MTGYVIIGALVLLGIFGYLRRPNQGPVVSANKARLRRMSAQGAPATTADFQWKKWFRFDDIWAYFTPRAGGPQWPVLTLATAVLLLVFKDFFFPEGRGVLAPIFWAGIIVVALCSVMLFGSWEDNRYRKLLSVLLFGALVWFVLRHTNLIYESPTEQKVAQALSLQLNRELEPVEKRAEELRLKAETEGLTPDEVSELKQLPRQEDIKKRHYPSAIPEDALRRLYKKAVRQLESIETSDEATATRGKKILAAALVLCALFALAGVVIHGGVPGRTFVVILAVMVLGYLYGFRLERGTTRVLVATLAPTAMSLPEFESLAARAASGDQIAYKASVPKTSTSHMFAVSRLGLRFVDAHIEGPARYEWVGQARGGIDRYRGGDWTKLQTVRGIDNIWINNNDMNDPITLNLLFVKE